jgi:hypothetical protein
MAFRKRPDKMTIPKNAHQSAFAVNVEAMQAQQPVYWQSGFMYD